MGGISFKPPQSLNLVILVTKLHFSLEVSDLIVLSSWLNSLLDAYPKSSIYSTQGDPEMLVASLGQLSFSTTSRAGVKDTHGGNTASPQCVF